MAPDVFSENAKDRFSLISARIILLLIKHYIKKDTNSVEQTHLKVFGPNLMSSQNVEVPWKFLPFTQRLHLKELTIDRIGTQHIIKTAYSIKSFLLNFLEIVWRHFWKKKLFDISVPEATVVKVSSVSILFQVIFFESWKWRRGWMLCHVLHWLVGIYYQAKGEASKEKHLKFVRKNLRDQYLLFPILKNSKMPRALHLFERNWYQAQVDANIYFQVQKTWEIKYLPLPILINSD